MAAGCFLEKATSANNVRVLMNGGSRLFLRGGVFSKSVILADGRLGLLFGEVAFVLVVGFFGGRRLFFERFFC